MATRGEGGDQDERMMKILHEIWGREKIPKSGG
jgi:hypothetical protein